MLLRSLAAAAVEAGAQDHLLPAELGASVHTCHSHFGRRHRLPSYAEAGWAVRRLPDRWQRRVQLQVR
jgi:hypothetical protein